MILVESSLNIPLHWVSCLCVTRNSTYPLLALSVLPLSCQGTPVLFSDNGPTGLPLLLSMRVMQAPLRDSPPAELQSRR